MPDRPNLVVALTDDHGSWCLGSYGNREVRTPTLDWLAATGVRMSDAFCPTPVCSPARASFWTGRLPSQHGIHDYLSEREPDVAAHDWLAGEVTLGQLLHDAGYTTALCGKWHCGNGLRAQPGFDVWYSMGQGTAQAKGSHTYSANGEAVELNGYHTGLVTDGAVRFLRERDRDRPFFLFVGYTVTHSVWSGNTERLVDSYRRCSFADIPGDPVYPFGRMAGESLLRSRFRPREAQAQYYAAATEIDEQLGRIVDELDAQGALADTLVVYTSDHGCNLGHHGLWGKGNASRPLNVVEESIRVPLILGGWQRLFGAQVRGEMVDHCDTFQTLLELANVQPPGDRDYPGRSYAQALRGRALSGWRQVQVGEYGNLRWARSATHKLVRRYPDGPHELFDLERDPRETTSFLGQPGYEPIERELDAAIEERFRPCIDSPVSGLKVAELPRHNPHEAWRGDPA